MKLEIWTEHGPQNSKPIFNAFIKSLEDAGETIVLNRSVNADVVVIWSVLWRGRMERYKHIWDDYRKLGKPVIVIEVGGLRRNESFKIGINGINRKADFANQEFDDKRWPLFKHNFKPWNPTGDIIVICGQHDASEQWKGLPRMGRWIQQQIKEIRQYTTRPILVRPHPRNNIDFQESNFDNVKVRHPKRDFRTYDDTDFKATLERTWAVVNHDVGNIHLRDINTPAMPNRHTWAHKLAYTEWFEHEIEQGLPWKRIKKRLEEKYLK